LKHYTTPNRHHPRHCASCHCRWLVSCQQPPKSQSMGCQVQQQTQGRWRNGSAFDSSEEIERLSVQIGCASVCFFFGPGPPRSGDRGCYFYYHDAGNRAGGEHGATCNCLGGRVWKSRREVRDNPFFSTLPLYSYHQAEGSNPIPFVRLPGPARQFFHQ
jgi:hypothetical protein